MGFRASGRAASILALAAGLAAGAPAWAQPVAAGDEVTNTPEIVVTAQRRSEKSVDVPITVSTLDQSQLRTANVNQLSDTTKLTPGLRFDSQGPAVQPTIRGVGTAITTSGGGPNVGIYVDGFFQSNTYVSDFQLMKAQNIQVLKGPQGTLFGRNTTGGAILVTTADPSTDTSAEFRASYGRFNTATVQGYATFGLTDKIAMDIEGIYSRGDGFQTNLANGDDKVGQYKSWSIRTGIKAQLSDDVSVLLRYIHSQSDNPSSQLVNAFVDGTGEAGFFNKVSAAGQAAYGRSNSTGLPLIGLPSTPGTYATRPGDVRLTSIPYFHTRSDTVQGTVKADLGFADLTSYTQYRYDNTPYTGDLDATASLSNPFSTFGIFVGVRDTTFSQEFLLSSHPGGRLQWTVGANYFQNKDSWDVQASFNPLGFPPFSPFGGSSTFTQSIAAFADATYALMPDKLFLTVGGRFSHDIVKDAYFRANGSQTSYEGADGRPVDISTLPSGTIIPVDNLKNDSFTPRVVLRYKPDSRSSVYASYSRGYKAGILNVGGLSKIPVKPEHIDAFELGYKYGDRTFSVDLAGYYYNYKNLQVSSFQNGAAQIRNAASSEIYGAEAQLRYKVSNDFNLNGGVTWTHARYKSFSNAPYYTYCDPAVSGNCLFDVAGQITQTTTDASGYHMQRAPSWTGNVGASYGLDLARGRLTLSGNLYYTSSFYFDPSQQFRQKPYETLSLRAEWVDPSQKYTLAVYGDNVTNRRYQTQVLFNTLGIGSVWNSPVTYGVSAGVKF